MEPNQEPFVLNCLKEEAKEDLSDCIKLYLKNKSLSLSSNVKIGNNDGDGDFTPWWIEFSKRSSNQTQLNTNSPSTSKSGSDKFDNWFDTSDSNLLRGSWTTDTEPKKEKSATKPEVEDIPVPSIYETKLSSKSKRALKRERKAKREETIGAKWFNMRAPDADDPARADMELIRMRDVLDPKRFYKNHDRKAAPKYFQMGTVVDEGTEFYGSRLTKKQRKNTLVEELMADANVRQYNKKKYAELQQKMRGKKKQKQKTKKV